MGFTGIVEEMGTVVSLKKVPDLPLWDGTKGEGVVLTVKCKVALGDAYVGASICINGTCLTVTKFSLDEPDSTAGTFEVNLAPETLRRTSLGDLVEGSKINLERAIRADGRNSGHNVQGHVDDTGKIEEFRRDGESLWVKIAAPPDVMRYVVPKGYIAIDGTSLTVCEVNRKEGWFNLMLIAHTQTCIVLPTRSVGDRVNIEVDVLAKYLESVMDGASDRISQLEGRIATLEANARSRSSEAGQCQAQIPHCKLRNGDVLGDPSRARWLPHTTLPRGLLGPARSTPSLRRMFSAVEPGGSRIEYLPPGLIALASFVLALLGLRKAFGVRKPARGMREVLMRA